MDFEDALMTYSIYYIEALNECDRMEKQNEKLKKR